MDTQNKIDNLYRLFESKFAKPVSFYNEYCCVDKDTEKSLLTIPLRELPWWEVNHAFQHAEGCFGRFEEIAYLLPRALELYNNDEWDLCYGLFRFILDNRARFEEMALFSDVHETVNSIFHNKTSVFTVKHYDEKECRNAGWRYEHMDIANNVDTIDEMVEYYYCPFFVNDSVSFIRFFESWASDRSNHRKLHFLDFLSRCKEGIHPDILEMIEFLNEYYNKTDYLQKLLLECNDLVRILPSPTWENDLRSVLKI